MIKRKKNLLAAQIILFALGILIIFFTYYNREQTSQIITLENKKKIDNTLTTDESDTDIFYNIQYSGIDLSGNRYILNAKEAINNNTDPELVAMKFVEVNFYYTVAF